MTRTEIIFAGHLPEDPLKWFLAEEGEISASGEAASLSAYAEERKQASGNQQVIILPGERFAARLVTSPAKSRQQLLQSARFLMEDDLAGPVEQLHLAVGPEQSDNQRPIVAVDTNYIGQWVEAVKGLELKLDILTADFLCLQLNDNDVVILADEGRLLVNVKGAGFAAERAFAEGMIGDLLPAGSTRVSTVLLGQNEADIVLLEDSAATYRVENESAFAKFFAGCIAEQVPVNLLQGAFEPGIDWKPLLKPWRRAAVMLAASLVLLLGLQVFEGVRFNSAAARINDDAANRFRSAFPDTPVRNLTGQARQLAGAASAARSDFLELSAVLTDALQENSRAELALLTYDQSGEMSADIQFASIADLDALKEALRTRGVRVEEGRTLTPVGNVYTGKLTLRMSP